MIYELLNYGKENALSKDTIKSLLDLDERSFYALLKKERVNGRLILSNTKKGGYYLPGRDQELEQLKEFKKMTENRAKSTFYILKATRKRIKELGG